MYHNDSPAICSENRPTGAVERIEKGTKDMPSMGDFGLNIADVPEATGSFELMPTGWYFVHVERCEETETGETSKNPGTPMFNIAVVVDQDKFNNRWVFDRIVMSQKALWKFKSFMDALGIDKDVYGDADFWPTEDWIDENVIGKQLDAKFGREPATDDYEAKNKVTSYRPHKFTESDLVS